MSKAKSLPGMVSSKANLIAVIKAALDQGYSIDWDSFAKEWSSQELINLRESIKEERKKKWGPFGIS